MRLAVVCALALGLLVGPAFAEEAKNDAAEEKPVVLKVGDKAPDFALPQKKKDGEQKKLSDFRGKKNVMLAFYPKVFTSGCTKQICNYRDQAQVIKKEDTHVIMISADAQPDSDRFKVEYDMPFSVLGDPELKVIKAYGVPFSEKGDNVYASRWLMLVDKEGIIQHVDQRYKVGEDWEPTRLLMTQLNQLGEAAAEAEEKEDK
jgi:peroxiredoxin Q/BCP